MLIFCIYGGIASDNSMQWSTMVYYGDCKATEPGSPLPDTSAIVFKQAKHKLYVSHSKGEENQTCNACFFFPGGSDTVHAAF